MFIESVKTGFKKGIGTVWFLSKIIVPVYIVVTVIRYTPLMPAIGNFFRPLMKLFDLPGEAAIPFITGFFLDEYGVIAAIKAISLDTYQITTIAIMALFFHTIFIESAVMKKLGLSISFFSAFRFSLAIIFGIIIGQLGGVLW